MSTEDATDYFKRVKRRTPRMGIIPRNPTAGRVIVHNHVRPQVPEFGCFPVKHHGRDMIGLGYSPLPGLSGFRVWTQDADPRRLRVCDCGYAGLKHYRFRKAVDTRTSWKGELYRRPRKARAEAA
jgi:hypothetical protein